uniref:Neur_chan_LBD domain-containing protein n=1 Tax=Steinernema glaseri TaxID=37863 RepID=A0A1I8A3W3_9BILA
MLSIFYFLLSVIPRQVTPLNSYPIPLYMDEMLHAGRQVYDKQSTPTQNAGLSTKVNLSMYIEGLSSFRTQTMDFQVDVYFQQFWRDARLAHNESKRILIRDKKILDKMWHPDIYFANARIAEFHEVTQPNFLIWIEPDGSILYDTRISMIVMCMMNLAKWPLDDQTCYLRILSYAYDVDQLHIAWSENEPITRNPNIAMSDMHIVDLRPGLCDGNYSTGIWSCVTAEFYVKREITHHVMQSYVPTTLIVVISWFSFWLDVEAVPARVSLAITTLLTLSTQANAARMALPEVSYMKAIDVWMGTCMMFVFGVMIEFTIVNYAQRQGKGGVGPVEGRFAAETTPRRHLRNPGRLTGVSRGGVTARE